MESQHIIPNACLCLWKISFTIKIKFKPNWYKPLRLIISFSCTAFYCNCIIQAIPGFVYQYLSAFRKFWSIFKYLLIVAYWPFRSSIPRERRRHRLAVGHHKLNGQKHLLTLISYVNQAICIYTRNTGEKYSGLFFLRKSANHSQFL